jgi:hypothetical protein
VWRRGLNSRRRGVGTGASPKLRDRRGLILVWRVEVVVGEAWVGPPRL